MFKVLLLSCGSIGDITMHCRQLEKKLISVGLEMFP